MDKRIIKTKQGLRSALRELLRDKPLDKISVKEICARSSTSRVTFYTYYGDKYDLFKDMLDTIKKETEELFINKQKNNNPENDFDKSLQNFIDTLYYLEEDFSKEPSFEINKFEVSYIYKDFILKCIERFENVYPERMKTRYPVKAVNSFLAYGLWGFLHWHSGPVTKEEMDYLSMLIKDLIDSNIFSETK
ncbi:MAG: TetR/AcrR family transcriptional regulator [Anaerovoracaceae bacterium]|jgi:AcrR family transcriptional regulator